MRWFPALLVLALGAAHDLSAQRHEHAPGMAHTPDMSRAPAADAPVQPGQAAYGAIAEMVRRLEADPATDWSKVNMEALRQHLIDMDAVTLRSSVVQRDVPGGMEATVTGTGRTTEAIRRMTAAHGRRLGGGSDYEVAVTEVPGGARMTVTAARADDARLVARIRGLGFIGLMASGDHHGPHHEMMARGAGHH